jgi:hypothetical protein
MDLIRALLVADARRRWRSWLAVVVITGVVGGISMGALAGWQRTTTAMDRFLRVHRPYNSYVEGHLERGDLAHLDGVEAVQGGDYFLLVPLDDAGVPHPEDLGKVSPFSSDAPDAFRAAARPIVVAGRLADPSVETEIVIDEEMADLYDLAPGRHLAMQGYGEDQIDLLFDQLGSLVPTGERFDFTVTGIVRNPQDVVERPEAPDVVYLGSAALYLGAAFDSAHRRVDVPSLGALSGDIGPAGANGFEVRIASGASRDAFEAAVVALDPGALVDFSPGDAQEAREEAGRSIQLQSTLVLVFGLLVAVGGLVLVAQVYRRQLEDDRATQRTLHALGLGRREAIGLALAKGAVVAGAATVVALGVAVALSPLSPVGHARRAEVEPGLRVDVAVLSLGAVALVLLVMARLVLPAWRVAATGGRDGAGRPARTGLSDRASRMGLPPSLVAGVRAAALGTGGSTVAAIVFVATLGIVGGIGFAHSEARLAGDPALWGWTFDAVVGDGNDESVGDRADETLADAAVVDGYATVADLDATSLRAGRREVAVDAAAIEPRKGAIAPALLEGRPPAADEEVAIGGATARQLGVGIGDEVLVALAGGDPTAFRVTGLAIMNLGYDADRIGEGALFTPDGVRRAGGEPTPSFVLVDYAPEIDPDAGYRALRADWQNTVLRPIRSIDVDQLHRVRQLPVWFSGLLAAVAAVTLAFVLGLTIRRRRHDLALLRTLGFDGRQLRATLLAQATTLVLPAAALGGIAGLIAGRLAWAATAESLGAPDVQVLPVLALVGVVLGALVVANVVATLPGRAAARTRPALVMRAE